MSVDFFYAYTDIIVRVTYFIWGSIMIVLLDINKQKLSLYREEGLIEIPFQEAATLPDYLEGKNVYYITNAIEVNAQDVIDMIRGLGVAVDVAEAASGGNRYLCGMSDGTIYIDENLKFEGKFDCKLIDEDLKQMIKMTPLLKTLIDNRKIKIIGENMKRKLMKEFKNVQNKQLEKQKMIDSELDNMILTMKVSDYEGMEDDNHPGAVEIDILNGGSAVEGRKIDTMTELLFEMEDLE